MMDAEGPAADQDAEDTFDVEAYSAGYVGHTKVARLLFVAEHAGPQGALEALRLAHDELRKTENTALYAQVVDRIGGQLGDGYTLDAAWVEATERKAASRGEKLEQELSGYKTNLIKESIRMGHNDLGDYHYSRADLQQAFKCYVRTRDYCTTSKHILQMCLNVIRVSIELGNFVHVSNYIQKAEQTPDLQDPVVLSKLRCASGLAALEGKKYKAAAKKFVEVHFDMGSEYADVISPQDVAVYGALCALASFTRQELKQRVLDNVMFRNFLELVPEVRELINDFYGSNYASCLATMKRLKPTLALDLHLHDHVDTLYEQIRQKALIQYVTPFSSVDLQKMASAFVTTLPGIMKELAALIMDGQVQARIDSHNKVMFARQKDQRRQTFANVLEAGKEYQRDTRAMLVRASLLQHDSAPRIRAGGGRRGAAGAAAEPMPTTG